MARGQDSEYSLFHLPALVFPQLKRFTVSVLLLSFLVLYLQFIRKEAIGHVPGQLTDLLAHVPMISVCVLVLLFALFMRRLSYLFFKPCTCA